MTLVSKTLPPNAPLVDPSSGLATPPFNRYLNSLSLLANTFAGGTLTTGPGSGLEGGGDLATNLSISIAANGVTNGMIRQSAGYSVIGRGAGTTGNVADITATADNRVLARVGGVLAFWDLALVPGAGTVTSVSVVTANGFSGVVANPTTTPAITLSYAGQALTRTDDTNVTLTLGGSPTTALLAAASITVGWSGTLAVTRGGTGLGTATQGDILYGSAANTYSALPKDTNATRYLSNTGTTNNPAWAQVNLANGVMGDLPYANFVQATQKCLVGATAAGDFGEITLGAGVAITAGVLSATGSGGSVTSVSVVTANGFSGTVATATTTPAITLSYAGAALTKTDDTNVTLTLGGTPTTALLVGASLTLGWTGTLAVARGGIGVGTLTNHGVLIGQGTSAVAATAVGGANTFLAGVAASDPVFRAVDVGTADVTGTLPVARGGTGDTTLAAHGVLIGNGTSAVSVTATGTAAQVLTSGGASADPTWQPANTVTRGIYEAASAGIPLLANFAWINQGDATAADGTGALLLTTIGNASANIRILKQAAPTAPYTVYMRAMMQQNASPNAAFGIILRNSTSGRLLYHNWYSPGATPNVIWQRWASATSFNANINTGIGQVYIPVWFRVDVTSTTARPYISSNGWDWVASGSLETLSTYVTATGGTVDEIGFGAQCSPASAAGVYYVSAFQTTAPT